MFIPYCLGVITGNRHAIFCMLQTNKTASKRYRQWQRSIEHVSMSDRPGIMNHKTSVILTSRYVDIRNRHSQCCTAPPTAIFIWMQSEKHNHTKSSALIPENNLLAAPDALLAFCSVGKVIRSCVHLYVCLSLPVGYVPALASSSHPFSPSLLSFAPLAYSALPSSSGHPWPSPATNIITTIITACIIHSFLRIQTLKLASSPWFFCKRDLILGLRIPNGCKSLASLTSVPTH